MPKIIEIKTIEQIVINAFYNAVCRYRNGALHSEADFRAEMHGHLRNKETPTLHMHLDKSLPFTDVIIKPDISIGRGTWPKLSYALCAEIKIARLSSGKPTDIDKAGSIEDINRMQNLFGKVPRAYTLRVERKDNELLKNSRKLNWQVDFYRDLYYVCDTESFFFYAVSKDENGKKIGGYHEIPFYAISGRNLFKQIENGFYYEHGFFPFMIF
jgi:hypothetical protein